MVDELTVNAATNVIEHFMQILFVLQTTPFLDTDRLTNLYDPLINGGKILVLVFSGTSDSSPLRYIMAFCMTFLDPSILCSTHRQ